jgi:lactate dehydrogenase-like 2-hydroxyacid dehydrogenase
MPPKILVSCPSAEVAAIAREMAPKGFETVVVHNDAEVVPNLSGIEYMITYPHISMRDPFYKAAPKLKLVQLLSAGYDNVDLEAARRAKVPLSNNGGANAISVSEHALMLMLTVSRKVVWQHGSVSGGRWRGNGPAPRMYELYDKTLGIIGLGTIGKKVARLGRAFGMRVQYFDIARLTEDEADALGVKFRLLRELLRSSDIVSLHVPLNDSTRHMIGVEELSLMKPTAIIINTSRGTGHRRSCAAQNALRREDLRGRARRVRPGAAALEQPFVQAGQCGADRTLRGSHLGQSRRAIPQCIRQRAAGRARRATALGRARARLICDEPATPIAGLCAFPVLLTPLNRC